MEEVKVDLALSDEEVARALFATHVPGQDTLNVGPLGPFLGQPDGALRYATVCRLMADMATEPALKADLLFGAVYGIRNGSGRWEESLALGLLDECAALITDLPRDQQPPLIRRDLYHRGLIAREVYRPGHFLRAAEIHETAAAIAPTKAKRVVELVVAAVERMHHAVEVDDLEFLDNQLKLLRETLLPQLTTLTATDPEALKWAQCDVPAHRFYCAWLMGRGYSERRADIVCLANLPEQFQQSYAVWHQIAEAALELENGELLSALYKGDYIASHEIHPTHVTFGLLIAARALARMGCHGVYQNLLYRIVYYPSHAAHFTRAVARRALNLPPPSSL
ncbi:MAG: hypothetical protein HYV42_04755 [Candidatus Magasanikbacteria bacterium]|nr:hypothetical protein [Candidatus Magasanikbacteria bacterium]